MKERKGEVTTQQIVTLIILIVSFVVILFLLFRLNPGKTTAEDVCHNSVTARGSGVLPKESVPLNCETSYICISEDGSCEAMSGSREVVKVKNKEEVYYNLAERMADCWWMFGEGKVNYVGNTFLSNLYCSICSQVAFDDSVDIFENRQIDRKTFYEYLSNNKVSGTDVTYLNYLTGLENTNTIEQTLKDEDSTFDFGEINLDKQQYIMMGIVSQVGVAGWIAGAGVAGTVVAITGIALAPVTAGVSVGVASGIIIITAGAAVGGVGGYFLGNYIRGESGQDFISPEIVEASEAEYDKFQCKSIKTLA